MSLNGSRSKKKNWKSLVWVAKEDLFTFVNVAKTKNWVADQNTFYYQSCDEGNPAKDK